VQEDFGNPKNKPFLIAVLSMLKVLLCSIPLFRQSLTQEKIKSYRLTLKLQKQDGRHLPQFLPLAMQFLIKMLKFILRDFQLYFQRNGNPVMQKLLVSSELDFKFAF